MLSAKTLNEIKAIFDYASPVEYIEHLTNSLTENLPDDPAGIKEAIILHTNIVNMVHIMSGMVKKH